jgi:hypothetical protein
MQFVAITRAQGALADNPRRRRMKATAFLWASMVALGALGLACAGTTSDGSSEGAAADLKSDKSDTIEFKCKSDDSHFLKTLKVTPGKTATFVATFDGHDTEYKATEDTTKGVIPPPDSILASWDKADPWQEHNSGHSWLVVSDKVLKGKEGDVKYETSKGIELGSGPTTKGTCSPK